MKFSKSTLLLGPAAIASLVDAAHFPVVGRRSSPNKALDRRSWQYTSALANSNDVSYVTNITLGGKEYTVQVDTGSSDLWVADDKVPNTKSTGKSAKVSYAIGEATGPILLADLEFAGYKVPQQAFFQVKPDKDHPTDNGLIGLGPGSVSEIFTTLKSDQGSPPVDNIFNQNKTTPNYLTVLLGRSDDPDNKWPGDLSIGEVIPGLEAVQSQPKLQVDVAKHGNQHWSIMVDAGGIIGPNGQSIPATTGVSSTKNKEQLTALFDTGYTLPQVPAGVAQGIYSQIDGAKLQNTSLGEVWTMDCDREVNITFKLGGQSYHIHPLDASMEASDLAIDGDFCVGTFQPIASNAESSDIDIIFGMAFLRNAYLLVNYGDWIVDDDRNDSKANPFCQLLSTSNDTSTLHAEFVQVRLGGVDTTYNQTLQAINTTGIQKSNSSSGGLSAKVKKFIIIGASVGGAILLLLVGACVFCCCRRKSKAQRYQPLHEPAPNAAVDVHMQPGGAPVSTGYYDAAPQYGGTAYIPPQGGQYQTSWDQQQQHHY